MEKTIFIQFEVFDESTKQKAMMIVSDCPGVNSVKVKVGGVLKVKGEFDKSEMMQKLKMIDENAEIFIEVGPDGVALVTEADRRSVAACKTSQPNGLWEMAKVFGAGAAEQAKIIGAGAAEQAIIIGAGAAEQAKVIGAGAAEHAKVIGAGAAVLILPNNRENGIKKKPKEEEGLAMGLAKRRKRFGGDQPDQPKEGGGIVKGILGYLGRRKFKEEARREGKLMREAAGYPKNHWMNMNNHKKGTTEKSEGTTTQGATQGSTTMGKTVSLLTTLGSKLLTGEASTSKPPLSTGQANTSTQAQRSAQTQKKKPKPVAKKGKNDN